MPFVPMHNIQRGVHRLIYAPQDVPVREPIAWSGPDPARPISPAHQALFTEYKHWISEAVVVAQLWWDGLVQGEIGRGMSPAAADSAVRDRIFAGPAAHGEVVWVIRTYWLRCVAINQELPPIARLPPQIPLLGWLIDEGAQHLVEVLTAMPYWPIGLDAKGDWV